MRQGCDSTEADYNYICRIWLAVHAGRKLELVDGQTCLNGPQELGVSRRWHVFVNGDKPTWSYGQVRI